MSSLFNCTSNTCARVVYQKYEPPGIRYRYPGEEWVEVDGDDWRIEEALTGRGKLIFEILQVNWRKRNNTAPREVTSTQETTLEIPILRVSEIYLPVLTYLDSSNTYDVENYSLSGRLGVLRTDSRNPTPDWGNTHTPRIQGNYGYVVGTDRNHRLEIEESRTCKLIILKKSVEVLEIIGDECPEVELIEDCELSDEYEEIRTNKIARWQTLKVVDNVSDLFLTELLENIFFGDIPPNCRDVWLAPILDLDFSSLIGDDEQFRFRDELYQYVGQICSADGCPPPEFTIYCDCECESCPDGTCAVICDDHVCCNDPDTGVNITSIPLDNYCGET